MRLSQLVEASRSARMVCVGHKGTDDSEPERRGATAAQVAQTAFSTVAVIRHRKERSPFHQWIVAVLDETPGSHLVLQTALDEATLRHAPVLALTSWSTTGRQKHRAATGLRKTLDRYLDGADDADIQVCAIPMPDHILNILKQSASIDQLVVVGATNTAVTRELMTPACSQNPAQVELFDDVRPPRRRGLKCRRRQRSQSSCGRCRRIPRSSQRSAVGDGRGGQS